MRPIAPLLLAPMLLVSSPARAADTATACESVFEAGHDYFPVQARATDAQLFDIEYHRSYKIVSVRLTEADVRPRRYVLVQCGAPRPALDDISAYITIPVRSVVALSNAYLPFLESSNVIERLVAVNKHAHVNSPRVLRAIDHGAVAEVGEDAGLDRERLLALRPGLVLTYGDDQLPASLQPLQALGVPMVISAEYRETTPLGYAEWVKFVGAFFNSEVTANAGYEAIRARYLATRARAAMSSSKPLVLVGGSYNGVWYVPPAQSYTAQLIADAGGQYAFASLPWRSNPLQTMLPVTLETALRHGRSADVWIDTLTWGSLQEVAAADPRYQLFDAFRSGQMYNNDAQTSAAGSNAYWERGLANPDTVLMDLLTILHPELGDGHRLQWYRRLPPQ